MQNQPQKHSKRELIHKFLRIRDKRGRLRPFKFNAAQAYYWEHKTRRNLIIKARQKGISKIIDADQLIDCIRKPINAVILSHEKEATTRLFASVRAFVMTMQCTKPAVSIDSKSEIRFPKRGSSYFIGTAGQRAFGRGDTVGRAHLSEAAFYIDLERTLGGIAEAAEYGQIDIETTPNGRDQVYDLWQKAKAGRSSYTPIFIPWFIDDEYSADNLTAKEKAGLSASVRELFAVPDADFWVGMDPEEQKLAERVRKDWSIQLTPGMMKWRRYKIWDRGELFFQEYPEDDVSCFLQSGRSVFTKIRTDARLRIPLDDLDSWHVKEEEKEALKGRLLYGGLDGAEGVDGGDAHNFSVIDVNGPKGAVIFEITSNAPIDVFDKKVADVCEQFDIFLGVEKNGVGVAHCQRLRHLGVRHVEYETTAANRPVMIADLEEAYRKDDLVETYPEAENEARDMIYKDSGRAEHREGRHDDRVFGRAIAWQMRKTPRPGVTFL